VTHRGVFAAGVVGLGCPTPTAAAVAITPVKTATAATIGIKRRMEPSLPSGQ
jgi:hypothetical protein